MDMKQKIKQLNKKQLQEIVLKMTTSLSKEQCEKLELLIDACMGKTEEKIQLPERMSQEFVNEKMKLLETWMNQIDEGELYLDVEEYEEYSDSYWDRDWVTKYYDNQGIGDKIGAMIQFAQDCVHDRKYKEANLIYEWLWQICVITYSEYEDECDPVDLETLSEHKIIHTDLQQMALLTLYADYQVQEPQNRAEDIYLYFYSDTFQKLHIQDMFGVGREELDGVEQFWNDWIALLQTKSGDTESRLLQEAVLYHEGIEGLVKMADQQCKVHPSLYLSAMQEYKKEHDYLQMETIGEKALGKIDYRLKIRSKIALMASYASSCLMHTEKEMQFCWEAFRSDSTDRNFLRLFGTKEMAEKYGLRGGEVLRSAERGDSFGFASNKELERNIISSYRYDILRFYTGDFEKAKEASRNPQGSLGWSGSFISIGIRLFLLYLYENPLPSKAAANIAAYVGFPDEKDLNQQMSFESDIMEESSRLKTSTFWSYFQKWKQYFPMSEQEKKIYFAWAKKIVYSRADAIVSGQHRRHYGEVAGLLAMAAETEESMGVFGAKQKTFQEYKKKFPRHSSFQAEMKSYFGM